MHITNEPPKGGNKNSDSILYSETVCSIENNQKVTQAIEVDGVKYQLDMKYVDNFSLHDMAVNFKHHDPPQCELDLAEVKQLQRHNLHLSNIIAKCESQHHHNKTPYHLDEHGIIYRESGKDQIFPMP